MRELYHTEEDIFPNERDKRKKKKTRGKKLFRVLNTLNVWVRLVSPSEEILLFCAHICAVNTTDKTLRLAFSHILSLSREISLRDERYLSVCCCPCFFVLLLLRSLKRERTLLLLIGIGFFRILSRGRLLWNRIVREEEEEEQQEQVRIKWPQR